MPEPIVFAWLFAMAFSALVLIFLTFSGLLRHRRQKKHKHPKVRSSDLLD